jgi:hypothetical protein
MIKLKIERWRELTDEEKAERKKEERYNSFPREGRMIYVDNIQVLEVEITEEQFAEIRKAVIERF